jgi:hypothetical protein
LNTLRIIQYIIYGCEKGRVKWRRSSHYYTQMSRTRKAWQWAAVLDNRQAVILVLSLYGELKQIILKTAQRTRNAATHGSHPYYRIHML